MGLPAETLMRSVLKILMLGGKEHYSSLFVLEKLLELEKVNSRILLFEDCTEKNMVEELRSADLFLLCPDRLVSERNPTRAAANPVRWNL